MRPIVYNKGYEMELHLLPKIRRIFGHESPEYQYVSDLIKYCHAHGVTRHELNLKPEWLARNNCKFWGLLDEQKLRNAHQEFLLMQAKLSVEHVNVEHVSDKLLRLGICASRQASNATALYYMQWLHGQNFDLMKGRVKVHRARLRQIGVDIAHPCDMTRFAAVQVINSEAVISRPAVAPDWYRHPIRAGLKLVA